MNLVYEEENLRNSLNLRGLKLISEFARFMADMHDEEKSVDKENLCFGKMFKKKNSNLISIFVSKWHRKTLTSRKYVCIYLIKDFQSFYSG